MKRLKEFVVRKAGEENAVVINIMSVLLLSVLTFGLLIVFGSYFSG